MVRVRPVLAALAAFAAMAALGGAIALWPALAPRDAAPAPSGRAHDLAMRRAEVKTRFEQGVVMLHAKRYQHAVTAFHRVLELAPDTPEAHVNLGYALLGLNRPREARDFFASATTLRPWQANAYYGLAEALEATGDLRGALGAMRTFVHLASQGDPFLRKARAALWEWEARLDGGSR